MVIIASRASRRPDPQKHGNPPNEFNDDSSGGALMSARLKSLGAKRRRVPGRSLDALPPTPSGRFGKCR